MVTARSLALHALSSLERGRIDRLRDGLANKQLESRDLAFAFDLAHGVLRRQRLLDHVLAGLAHRGLPKDPQLQMVLRLGAYQLLFVRGMPAHAAVHETVEMVRGNRGFANALLRGLSRAIASCAADPADPTRELSLAPELTLMLPAPLPADAVERLAIVHSLPDFFVERCREQLGDAGALQVVEAASATPGVFLRVAGDRDRSALQQELAASEVRTAPADSPRLLRWNGGNSPFATAAFRAGHFLVQDPTALAAAEAVPCQPGDKVIDLCAAPGTKTTRLAERVRPGGRVFAYDIDPVRRRRIVDNVARLRLQDVVEVVDSAKYLPLADAVLADVPCSNSGVLGRRVEVRNRLEPGTFAELAAMQRPLLQQAIALCKPGGAVVYSTCSIDREENDAVVAAVLADPATKPCALVTSQLTLPLAEQHDGGFFAVLRRVAP